LQEVQDLIEPGIAVYELPSVCPQDVPRPWAGDCRARMVYAIHQTSGKGKGFLRRFSLWPVADACAPGLAHSKNAGVGRGGEALTSSTVLAAIRKWPSLRRRR
jgi:hypothetical protein